jgi:hypothetical protein
MGGGAFLDAVFLDATAASLGAVFLDVASLDAAVGCSGAVGIRSSAGIRVSVPDAMRGSG